MSSDVRSWPSALTNDPKHCEAEDCRTPRFFELMASCVPWQTDDDGETCDGPPVG